MLIEDRLCEGMLIIDKLMQVLRLRIFNFNVETPKASIWDSTSALIAEPDSLYLPKCTESCTSTDRS